MTVQVPAVAPLPAGIARVAGSVIVDPPGAAATAPVPAHVVEALGVAAIARPAGSVSTSGALSDAAPVLPLESVRVIVEVAPAPIDVGANDLAIVGAAAVTTRSALAGAALDPLEVCSAFAAMAFVYVPPNPAATSTVTVQLPGVRPLAAGIDRVAGSVTVDAPEAAATAPLPGHVVAAFAGLATTRPAGSVSVNAALRFAALAFGFESVMVSVELAFGATGDGLKDFATVGPVPVTVSVVPATALVTFAVPPMRAASLV